MPVKIFPFFCLQFAKKEKYYVSDTFNSSRDVQIAVVVQSSNIASVQPPIFAKSFKRLALIL